MIRFQSKPIKGVRKDIAGNRTLEEFIQCFRNDFKDLIMEGFSAEVQDNIVAFLREVFAVYPFDGLITHSRPFNGAEPSLGVTWTSDNDYYLINLSFNRDGSYNLKVHRGYSGISCNIKKCFDKSYVLINLKKYLKKCEVIEKCEEILKKIEDIDSYSLNLSDDSFDEEVDFDKVTRENPKVFMIQFGIAWEVHERPDESLYLRAFLVNNPNNYIIINVREGKEHHYFDYKSGNVPESVKYKILYETERSKFIFESLFSNRENSSDGVFEYNKWVIKDTE